MLAMAIIELAKEGLHTFNNIYEDIPVAQRRANFFILWNLFKPSVLLVLTDEQREAIEEAEKQLTK